MLVAAYMYVVVGDDTWRRPTADGLIYWGVNAGDPYAGATVGGVNAYLYSPAFAQVFALIGLMPREVFQIGWTLFLAAVAVWLARPWPASLLVLALPVSQEILIGQIHLLFAAAIVLGFRWAGTWAFVLLTKVTPGRRPVVVRGPPRVAAARDRAVDHRGDRRHLVRPRA